MNNTARKTIIHTILFILATACIALVLEYIIPDDEHAKEILQGLKEGATVVYFGDSTLAYSDKDDIDKRLLSEMVEENLNGQTIIAVHQGAFHLRVFEAYVSFIVIQDHKPKSIILPINLRSFGPQWDLRPGYQFTSEIYRLSPQRTQPKVLLDRIKKLSDDPQKREEEITEWLEQPIFFNRTQIGVVNDFHYPLFGNEAQLNEKISEKFTYNYLFALDKSHKGLASLKNIVHLTQQHNITLVMYITPLNYQNGEKYVGDAFVPLIEHNVDIIKETVKSNRGTIYDFTFLLNSSEFSYDYIPDEHLNEAGKLHLAHAVALALQNETSKKS